MNRIEKDYNKACSPNLIFYYKNCFQDDWVNSWTKKLTLKTENVKILTILPQIFLQDIKNPLRGLIGTQKPIEFHLPHYKIPQSSPHYPTSSTIFVMIYSI